MQSTASGRNKPQVVAYVVSLLLLALLCLAALALRWRGLDAQSLWLDEGVSVGYANLGPTKVWQLTFGLEPNPPLYFLLLWAWLQVWGQSEVAVRGLSALAGALAVLPAYALGRELGNRRSGLLAALAAAASPYLLWYSQEARAFALLALLSATLLYLTCRAGTRPSPGSLTLWAVVATLVLYTHLYGAFSVAAAALFLLATVRTRLLWLLLALLGPAAAYYPWLSATLATNDPSQNWRAELTALELLGRALAAVTHNGALGEQAAAGAVAALVGLALLGMVVHRWRATLLLGTAIVLPLAASYLLSVAQPVFGERYLIAIAVPGYVAASLGIVSLARRLRGLDVAAALAVAWLGVQGVQAFQQESFAKENFRAAAGFVTERTSPGDVVILIADYVRHPFAYYYRGPARLVGFTGDPKNPEPFLRDALGEARTVWLLESHAEFVDPEHRVRQWLMQRFPLATEAYPRGIHLRAFTAKPALPAPPGDVPRLNVVFGPLRLAAAQFPPATAAKDAVFHPPSGWLPVTLYWQTAQPTENNYRLLLQLVDAKGVWGVNIARDNDLFAKLPASKWRGGETMVSVSDLVLNPDMPAGSYRLQLAVLDQAGQPVPGFDAKGQPLGAPLALGDVHVR